MKTSVQGTQQPFGVGRMTAQRAAIVDAIETMRCAFTVDALVGVARAEDATIGVATVYRAVSALEKSRWLERVGERAGSALYARCAAGDRHHHHVICTSCGRLEPADCPLGGDVSGRETASGFLVTGHEVTLYGLCPECVSGGKR